ncbi:MAG: hypothetical protein NTX79_05390 [Candidatus Micrarchaeota archaeon]|nr:hypothetical protein [Candidatus Micrarchaeota archaeon]
MASAFQLIGYLFQIAGMLVMFYAFVMLAAGIQQVTGGVTSSAGQSAGLPSASQQQNCTADGAEAGECEDFSTPDGFNAALTKRIVNFGYWLAGGLALLFIGLGMRAGGEIGGFFAKLLGKEKNMEKAPVGLRGRDIS